MNNIKSIITQKLVLLAFLTATVIILQLLASFLPIYPFRLNLVIIPIVIGAALISPLAGCWLGMVFGIVVLASSPDVIPFMTYSPLATLVVILSRGALAGLFAGLVYKIAANKNKTIGVILAAVTCAVTNSGLLVVGIYVFFLPLFAEWGIDDVASYIFLVMIGVNFLIEMAINLVMSPTIVRLIQISRDKKST